MSDIKLTKAQRSFLEALADPLTPDHEREAHIDYAPTNALTHYRFAERRAVGMYRGRFTITPAGRAWLAAHPRRKK